MDCSLLAAKEGKGQRLPTDVSLIFLGRRKGHDLHRHVELAKVGPAAKPLDGLCHYVRVISWKSGVHMQVHPIVIHDYESHARLVQLELTNSPRKPLDRNGVLSSHKVVYLDRLLVRLGIVGLLHRRHCELTNLFEVVAHAVAIESKRPHQCRTYLPWSNREHFQQSSSCSHSLVNKYAVANHEQHELAAHHFESENFGSERLDVLRLQDTRRVEQPSCHVDLSLVSD
mmetsp:Transcript_9345/g.14125  ORF Transcript_9345/g.14125 Transcript_9345/m.14125 type:complete len:228 (-) Transcript_9345:1814-2497(-)